MPILDRKLPDVFVRKCRRSASRTHLDNMARIVLLARMMEWASTTARHPFFDRLYRVISTGLREFDKQKSLGASTANQLSPTYPHISIPAPLAAAIAFGATLEAPRRTYTEFVASMTSLAAVGN